MPSAKSRANGKVKKASDATADALKGELPFPVVGIGASAGGLEACQQFLRGLSSKTGMAFVLIQHLSPNYESMLPQILGKNAPIPVQQARNGVKLKPNYFYVIPPNHKMTIDRGQLFLHPKPSAPQNEMKIDAFLRSLAETQGSRSIAVILSGTGTDGALGAADVKRYGGIVFSQDSSAKYEGMSRAAQAADCVDFILAPAAIAGQLSEMSKHPYAKPDSEAKEKLPKQWDEASLSQVFQLLKEQTGVDFTHYKQSTIQRRILRRMALKKIARLEAYLGDLKKSQEETEGLYHDLLIKVTHFFRDKETFDFLRKSILPSLLKGRQPDAPLRIWVPGCSTGEEVYSLAICFLEYFQAKKRDNSFQIFATDISNNVLEKARAGYYIENIAFDVSSERLRRFFTKVEKGYQIAKSIRDLCVFARHNVVQDPPFSRMDLISCRNLLIYLDHSLQRKVLPTFHYALKPDGYLSLGSSESIGAFAELFSPVDKRHKFYSKKAVPSRVHFAFDTTNYFPDRDPASSQEPVSPSELQRVAERLLLNKYTPASVIIDGNMDILHFRGNTGKFLEPASGTASLNLLRMAREGLMVELRSLIKKARLGSTAKKGGLTVTSNGDPIDISIEAVPLMVPAEKQHFYLVLFREEAPAQEHPDLVKAQRRNLTRQNEVIQKELAATKDYLQALIEEKEAVNEELKSANEEILSSNEELQITNEELETAKEELQSTNEELTTVNEELQIRHAELGVLNSDLENLLGSLDIPILMVDGALQIRRFNAGAEKTFNVSSVDIGRPIREIRPALDIDDLEKSILKVSDTMQVQEIRLQNKKGRWQLLRIRPYRTVENKIDGAVLTLIDIHELQISYDQVSAINAYAKAIVETIREPLLVLDDNLRILSANQSFFDAFEEKVEDTIGRQIFELGNGQWNNLQIRALLNKVQNEGPSRAEVEIDHEFPKIGRRIMSLNARSFELPDEGRLMLVAMSDITQRKQLERANVEISDQEQRRIGEDLHDGLGQHLTGLALMAKTLEKRLLKSCREEAESAHMLVENIQQAIQKVRHISQGLSPVQCEEDGLPNALEILCRSVKETASIACSFKASRSITVKNQAMAIHLYRIAQEAVNNAIRHAEAKRIEVNLIQKGDSVSLLIQDDGKGLDAKAKKSGMGLSLMNYRAKLIGADLQIRRVKKGTIVRCTVDTRASD